jgi:capsular exopolysaccharide synthesis family protein
VNLFLLLVLVLAALGAGAAIVASKRRDRFRDLEDLQTNIEVPVLAAIPRLYGSGAAGGLITATEPRSNASDAFRILKTNVEFISDRGGIRSLLVTSADTGLEKSATTANLGYALAEGGRRVILVSADLRRPTLGHYFSIADELTGPGLSTWLTGQMTDVTQIVRDVGIQNLRVMPSGPVPANPAELCNSALLADLLITLQRICDLVLVDSPPVLAVPDASLVGRQLDGCVLVVDAKKTRRLAAREAKEELHRRGARLVGAVMSNAG